MSEPAPTPAGMVSSAPKALPAACLARARKLMADGQRKILGIVAPPGAGKSTLAQALVQALGEQAQLVPMDGFHLSNRELERLGRRQRKGAPDTFDAAGYVNLLQRLKQQTTETIYAPDFDRALEEGIAASIAITPVTTLIVTEGNYLLLPDGAWAGVRPLVDEMWYLHVDDAVRQQRLLERHIRFGRSEEAALQWIAQTDEPNAMRIHSTQSRADWFVREQE